MPIEFVERFTGGARADETLPLIIAIHGLGDSPEAFADLFMAFSGRARIAAGRGIEPYHGGYSWFPIAGRGPGIEGLAPGIELAATSLTQSIRQLAATRPTCGRPIVTGFSQGGMLSYALAAFAPDLIASAVPVSGLLPASLLPPVRRGVALPIVRAMHGDADPRVPVSAGRATVAALRAAGYDATMREFGGVGHTISSEMRAELDRTLREAIRRTCPTAQ